MKALCILFTIKISNRGRFQALGSWVVVCTAPASLDSSPVVSPSPPSEVSAVNAADDAPSDTLMGLPALPGGAP